MICLVYLKSPCVLHPIFSVFTSKSLSVQGCMDKAKMNKQLAPGLRTNYETVLAEFVKRETMQIVHHSSTAAAQYILEWFSYFGTCFPISHRQRQKRGSSSLWPNVQQCLTFSCLQQPADTVSILEFLQAGSPLAKGACLLLAPGIEIDKLSTPNLFNSSKSSLPK